MIQLTFRQGQPPAPMDDALLAVAVAQTNITDLSLTFVSQDGNVVLVQPSRTPSGDELTAIQAAMVSPSVLVGISLV